MNNPMVIPYVVTVDVSVVDRCEIEAMEQVMPFDYAGDEFDFVAEQLGLERGIATVNTLEEFCLAVNEQELDNLSGVWVWHFMREIE